MNCVITSLAVPRTKRQRFRPRIWPWGEHKRAASKTQRSGWAGVRG